jgi:PAS domain S-box-containing protein
VISAIGVWYFFLLPFHHIGVYNDTSQAPAIISFFVLSGFIIALGESNRRWKLGLERSEFRFRRLIDSNTIPIICGQMRLITEANDAFLKLVGYTREDLHAERIDWMNMTPLEHRAKDMEAMEQLKSAGSCTPFEKEYTRRDGKRVPILVGGTALNASPLQWLGFALDLSELKRMEAQLRQAHDELERTVEQRTQALSNSLAKLRSEMDIRRSTEQQLRELSARLLRLQDEERRRVARDLHDSTGQTLSALKITLSFFEKLVSDIPGAQKLLDDLNALTDQAVQEVRTTSHLLHPPLLDEAGFASAAQWYVDGFAKRSGIKAQVDFSNPPPLDKDAEVVFFRILQEGLTNVLRHSGSDSVDVCLKSKEHLAVLSIRDYGRGIPADKLTLFRQTGAGVGVGLGGMKQRVRELGGQLRVESDSAGTCVTATLPVTRTNALGPGKNGLMSQAIRVA